MVNSCEIATPIEMGGKVKEMRKQKGLINTDTWIFTPDASCKNGQVIYFRTEAGFRKGINAAKEEN